MIIQQDGKQMAELQDGNSFGEISLIDNTTRNAGIISILILPQFIQILLWQSYAFLDGLQYQDL